MDGKSIFWTAIIADTFKQNSKNKLFFKCVVCTARPTCKDGAAKTIEGECGVCYCAYFKHWRLYYHSLNEQVWYLAYQHLCLLLCESYFTKHNSLHNNILWLQCMWEHISISRIQAINSAFYSYLAPHIQTNHRKHTAGVEAVFHWTGIRVQS